MYGKCNNNLQDELKSIEEAAFTKRNGSLFRRKAEIKVQTGQQVHNFCPITTWGSPIIQG
jgi:hypothetical protein